MTMPATCDLLLEGGSVVTVDDDRRMIDPGSVAISGNRITAVGTKDDLSSIDAVRTIDCTGRAVLPGLIDTHNHLFQALGRTIGEGMSLWPWLSEFMFPYAAHITSVQATAGVAIAAVESVRAGTTSVVDNHYSPVDLDTTLAVASTIESVGLRGVVARGITGEITPVAERYGLAGDLFKFSADEEIEITRAAIEARPPGSLVGVWPMPLNIIYNDQDLVHRSVELAHDFGTGWHTHCSEAVVDPDIYLEEYGERPISWLYREGLLGQGATIAHGIHLDDDEVAQVGSTGTGVAYNPVSNAYLASGVLQLRDLRAAGATVGLGTDGPCCNHRQDMFEVMKQSILLQRVHTLDPTASNGEEALEMATREGARYLGIDAGRLEPGRLADVIVVDMRKPHLTPHHRTVGALVYAASGSDVEYTIIDGRIVYESGSCTLVDERAVMVEAQEHAEALVADAGFEPMLEPWRFKEERNGQPARDM
jgi:5-methylthioadenosine/S-adenosylhomocysteine deaminase